MTLQASGPISMSQVRGEHGGSPPDSLSEYYRGQLVDSHEYIPAVYQWIRGPYYYDPLTAGGGNPTTAFKYAGSAGGFNWYMEHYYGGIYQGTYTWPQSGYIYTGPYSGYEPIHESGDLYGYYTVTYEEVQAAQNIPRNTNTPTSGTISMSQLYSTTNY